MSTTHSVRAAGALISGGAAGPDLELEEMEGFGELGMHRRALAAARRVLRREKLTGKVFSQSVTLVLSCVTKVESWIAAVEDAWKRLSPKAKDRARPAMLGFRFTVKDFDGALRLATVRPRDCGDFMFSLNTFTHHREDRKARQLVDFGLMFTDAVERSGCAGECAFEQGMFYRAIAHHLLARRDWGKALRVLSQMPAELVYIDEQHLRMAEALRRMVEAALNRLEKLSSSEFSISHPGLDDRLISDARRRLNRLRKSLAWVKPTD